MRTVLLLLVMVGLLAGSFKAVAHVDAPMPASSHASVYHATGDDVPANSDQSGTQKHCDLCAHGFGHFAIAVPLGPRVADLSVVRADGPALPPPTARPDLRDRPPK